MVFRTLTRFAAGKRAPLIKFRKGGITPAVSGGGGSAAGPTSANQASSPAASSTKSGAIEDWELPSRYWRKPIDPVEMEYINRGGPA